MSTGLRKTLLSQLDPQSQYVELGDPVSLHDLSYQLGKCTGPK